MKRYFTILLLLAGCSRNEVANTVKAVSAKSVPSEYTINCVYKDAHGYELISVRSKTRRYLVLRHLENSFASSEIAESMVILDKW